MKRIALYTLLITAIACNPSNNDSEVTTPSNESEASTASESKKPVRVKTLQPEVFKSFFNSTGTIEATQDAFISPEVNGQISKIYVDQGDEVKSKDLLIKLNTDVTKRNINEVKTNLELANQIYEKQKQLWEKKIGSEVQFLEAKNARESLVARLETLESQLQRSYIRAPFDGIVDDIMVKEGELASPGMSMLRLVNLDKMKVTSMISESFLGNVQLGDTIELSFANYDNWKINKPITRIGTVIDPVTRTFEIEVILDNPDQKLRPNMLSSLRIQDYADTAALLVPSIILKEDFKGVFLFKAIDNGSYNAKKTYVKTGKTVQDVTKIVEGVKSGDLIITEGYNMVSNGEAINIINQ